MGGKSNKAPDAPNYENLARVDAEEQRKTAQELTRANRPTQIDQYGNQMNWRQDPSGNWVQSVQMNPALKAQQDRAIMNYGGMMDTMARQGQFNQPDLAYTNLGKGSGIGSIGNFDRTQGDRVAADMYESVMGRARPEQQRKEDALGLRLRQQGLQPGTEAYDRAMQNMLTAHGDVATQAGLAATQAGYGAARDIYNTNLAGQGQRFDQALAGGQQRQREQGQRFSQALTEYQMPGQRAAQYAGLMGAIPGTAFEGFGSATGYNPASMTNAAQNRYQAQMGGFNAGQNKKNSLLGAGTDIGTSIIGKGG